MLDEPTAKLLALKNAIVAIGGMTGAFMVALFFMPDDMRVRNPWMRTAALGWVGGSFAVMFADPTISYLSLSHNSGQALFMVGGLLGAAAVPSVKAVANLAMRLSKKDLLEILMMFRRK